MFILQKKKKIPDKITFKIRKNAETFGINS